MNTSLILQVAGTILVIVSLSLIATTLGIFFAGVSLVAFGIAAERN